VDGEFVVVDLVAVAEEKFVLMIEGKRSSLGQAQRQCLLSMKDMGDKMAEVRSMVSLQQERVGGCLNMIVYCFGR
jgi:hypothetical protein